MGCTPERYRLVIGGPTRRRLDSELVATGTISEVTMRSLQRDEERTLAEWTTMFQLFIVALDPYTVQSAAVLPVATRLLREYAEADCRAAFLMACDADDARQFLGPLTDELMVFVDPDRTVTKALGLTSLPALVHVDQSPAVVTRAIAVFGCEFLQAVDLGLLGFDLVGLFFQAVGLFVCNRVFTVSLVSGQLVFDFP
jgi:hypothetical protein